MSATEQPHETITVNFAGPVKGQVINGNHNVQINRITPSQFVLTNADLEILQEQLAELRARVAEAASEEKREAALERVNELQEALLAEKPDLPTMEYVKGWFLRNLPGIAGSVTSLIVSPIVGKLVEVSGEVLAAEFRRRFGG
ncbi:MAG: hypothetical protein P8186_20765 [Anaerolineae bacterium]|jgi:hypothetical protein